MEERYPELLEQARPKCYLRIILADLMAVSSLYTQQFEWAATYSGPASESGDQALGIVVDQAGNVYVTGASGVVVTESDYAIIKYNRYGDSLWVRRYNDSTKVFAAGFDITLDQSGNIYAK